MAREYTYSEARQKLASLLERALTEGMVRIRRKDGQAFVIQPATVMGSPLDVAGIDLNLSRTEIVEFIHEGRRYG